MPPEFFFRTVRGCTFNVVVPRNLDHEQRELYERVAGSMSDHNLRSDEGVFAKLKRAFGG